MAEPVAAEPELVAAEPVVGPPRVEPRVQRDQRQGEHRFFAAARGQGNWLQDLDFPDQFEPQRVKIERLDDQ